jgi:hypothetical protein
MPGFDHAAHGKQTACGECHVLVDPAQGRLTRPGSNQHAPCDRCHADKFFQPPGPFCKGCHVNVDPRVNAPATAPTELTPWPPANAQRRDASVFDHHKHLDKEKMDAQLGFHASCRDCHIRQEGAERAEIAGHVSCAPCHGGAALKEGVKPPSPTMNECTKCHSETVVVPQGRRMITGDLTFSHARHEKDKAGQPIFCGACHRAVEDARDVEHIMLPAMQDCAKCHEDPARTGPEKRMANCGLCHKEISAGVAPRDHLGAGTAPDNHTIVFRTEHAEAARSERARCRFCHGGMSSTTKDNCHECHTVMKPRDHTLRWGTYDHGDEAAVNRERCATCHDADYCSRCHSQRPRSHTPYDAFVNGGHGVEARMNMRKCLACHTYDTNCGRCHQGLAFPGGKPR